MENHFERLDELIQDDDKIVTIISYTFIANLSLKESREVFDKYVEQRDSKNLRLTYILNGTSSSSGTLSVVQASEDTIEDAKKLFKGDPTVMIFSIQKAKNIDFNIISLAEDELKVKEKAVSGCIIGKNCEKRVLHTNVLPELPPSIIRGKSSVFLKQGSSTKSVEKVETSEKPNSIQDKKTNGTLTSMFNKANQAKKGDAKQPSTEQKLKQNGALSNFLSKNIKEELSPKQLEKNGSKVKSECEQVVVPKENINVNKIKSDLFDSDSDEEILKDLKMHEEPKSIKSTKKNTTLKKKREKKDVGNDKLVKKRKRIIVDEDSDSDIFASDQSDNEENSVQPEKEIETEKLEVKESLPKNKRRKAVKKMYEDAEGFIVTQTEYVYETASEDENEAAPKISEKTQPEVKPKLEKNSTHADNEVSPKRGVKGKAAAKKLAGNQPTLMNFFRKK